MTGKKHARPRGGRRNAWVLGLVAACLVAGGIYWSVDALLSDQGSDEDAREVSPSASPEPGTPSASPGHDTKEAVNKCASDLSAAAKVLSAARLGVHHWHIHVQARTDALADRISGRRLNRIFNRTRLGGPRDQHRYHAAQKGFSGKLRCDFGPKVTGSDKGLVADCTTRARAADRALSTAAQAMTDWRRHLKRMAMFRHGGMSAHRAQHLWVKAWRTAPVDIAAFQRADTAYRATSTCQHLRT
jgi:hypothetical protein